MDTAVGPAAGDAEGGKGENAAVAGKETVWERAEDVEGGCPGSADPKRVQESAHEGWERAGRAGPGEGAGDEWGGRDRESEPRGWADNQGELSVKQPTLVQRPVPGVLKQARAVGQEGADPVMQGGAGCGGAVGRGGRRSPG